MNRKNAIKDMKVLLEKSDKVLVLDAELQLVCSNLRSNMIVTPRFSSASSYRDGCADSALYRKLFWQRPHGSIKDCPRTYQEMTDTFATRIDDDVPPANTVWIIAVSELQRIRILQSSPISQRRPEYRMP